MLSNKDEFRIAYLIHIWHVPQRSGGKFYSLHGTAILILVIF